MDRRPVAGNAVPVCHAITVAELRAGVALLPACKRWANLQKSLDTRVLRLFAGRVLPFVWTAPKPMQN